MVVSVISLAQRASTSSAFMIAGLFIASPKLGWWSHQSGWRIQEQQLCRLRWVSPLLCFTNILDRILHHVHHRFDRDYALTSDQNVFLLSSILLWGILSSLLVDLERPPILAFIGSWLIGGVATCIMMQYPISIQTGSISMIYRIQQAIYVGQLTLYWIAAIYAFTSMSQQSPNDHTSKFDSEKKTLKTPSDSGDDSSADSEDEDEEAIKKLQQDNVTQSGGWFAYTRSMCRFLPYILPYNDRPTQAWLAAMILCIMVDRVTNVLIPTQLGIMTEALTISWGTGNVPIKEILIYMMLQFPLNAILNIIKTKANANVYQFSACRLKTVAFNHVMDLSMDYHTSRSTGQVIRAIEQGSDLSGLIDYSLYLFPVIFDLLIALFYLSTAIDMSLGYLVLVCTLLTIYLNFKSERSQSQLGKEMAQASRSETSVVFDTISNWYTVIIHNRVKYEQERYSKIVESTQNKRREVFDIGELFNSATLAVTDIGFFIAMYITACRSADGKATISTVVFLSSYWSSVTGPMTMLSFAYQEVFRTFINAEWLNQLLQTKPSVIDKTDAYPLKLSLGKVEFTNVGFSYDSARELLKDISFTAEPGQSIALVGETGSGKSSILKLLWRLYDVTEGSISIDGQDVRDVTIESLRECLGIVPQDLSVFNQTIMENLKYAKEGATDAEVYEACKAAHIHNQIMTFPHGYASKIGERGVRLSGGELQRVAIARVILRKPNIVVLDEATSSVDSGTEAHVQLALKALCKGRTVFTVAHRLSTIINADTILVIDKGKIVERGRHSDLVALGGKYSKLWRIQTEAKSTDETNTEEDDESE